MAALYSFEWLVYHDGRIVRSQRSLYFSEEDTCDPEDMKIFVRENILKKDTDIITIQNIRQVRPEMLHPQHR